MFLHLPLMRESFWNRNMKHEIPYEIAEKLQSNQVVSKQLKSVIWFGSIRNKQDVHERSDYDMQIILSEASAEVTIELNRILRSYPFIDLSIMYMQDIYDKDNNIIFHDGTKGLFFVYVLAEGKVIFGDDIYSTIIDSLDQDSAKPSVLLTIREYLSRLRVMAAQSPNDTMQFKKYSLKFFKDILLYTERVQFRKITALNNEMARTMIEEVHNFSDASKLALVSITDYEHNYSEQELANLLYDYEQLVKATINE